MSRFQRDVCVIGGAGHVGLPLAMTFADSGLSTVIYDINTQTVQKIRQGEMPFAEAGGADMLKKVLAGGKLTICDSPELLSECEFLILVIGTPVDEHLNPNFTAIHRAIDKCEAQLRNGQTLILRSTVFPGISKHIQRHLKNKGLDIKVAFCPERVVQGFSLEEFRQFPQIVSAFDPATLARVKELFGHFTPDFFEMEPMEAELCKLMTNSWRYIQFATVNQFYTIATQHGVDFDRILAGCKYKYPRMAGMPGAGFTAGPCLAKDTMQLAAFSQNTFGLGHMAMLVNEGLPSHVVEMVKRHVPLSEMTTGILGMAFKAENDDPRDSLSYKLRKLLMLESKRVLCADPYVQDKSFLPQEQVIEEADVLFIGAPHKRYRTLKLPKNKIYVDVWNALPPSEATRLSTSNTLSTVEEVHPPR